MTILANVLAVLHSYNRSFSKYVIYDFRLFAELNVLWANFKSAQDQQKNNIAEHSRLGRFMTGPTPRAGEMTWRFPRTSLLLNGLAPWGGDGISTYLLYLFLYIFCFFRPWCQDGTWHQFSFPAPKP